MNIKPSVESAEDSLNHLDVFAPRSLHYFENPQVGSKQAHHVHAVLLKAPFVKVDFENFHVAVASLNSLL